MITSVSGTAARPLGLAAYPDQDKRCVKQAFGAGINYFFFYGPGHASFVQAVAELSRKNREEIIVATGSGARKRSTLLAARRRVFTALGADFVDVFFSEYIHPDDDPRAIFGADGVLDQLQRWKEQGTIRFVGATAHDRAIAKRLAEDARVDVLMHRFNMAHRKAAVEVFPTARRTRTPIVAFTATRWGTLLEPNAKWPGQPPSAAECYRYCLSHLPVEIVLTAPVSVEQLDENLEVLHSRRMNDTDRGYWEQFGDIVYGRGTNAFETRWP